MEKTEGRFALSCPIPSKKNSYRVHFDKSVLQIIAQSSHLLRGANRRWWIAPGRKIKEAETLIAWVAKTKLPEFPGEVEVEVELGSKIQDLDNALGVIFDGLQKSGRIRNDRCIAKVTAIRNPKIQGISVAVREISEGGLRCPERAFPSR